jgi:hypothetical protein
LTNSRSQFEYGLLGSCTRESALDCLGVFSPQGNGRLGRMGRSYSIGYLLLSGSLRLILRRLLHCNHLFVQVQSVKFMQSIYQVCVQRDWRRSCESRFSKYPSNLLSLPTGLLFGISIAHGLLLHDNSEQFIGEIWPTQPRPFNRQSRPIWS